MIRKILMVLLPLLVLALGAWGSWKMIESRPQVETRSAEVVPPLIRTVTVVREDVRFTVMTQGTVTPRTESVLVPEISGRLTFVSPSLQPGGFFEQEQVLARIDPVDYELSLVRSRAQVAQTRMLLERELAEREVARREWEALGQGEPTALVTREPQLAEAQAALEAAQATLAQAERNLQRTEIRAPYAGRTRRKNVDIGQFVTVGTPLATLYAVDYAEVRLPLPDSELAYLNLPLDYRGEERAESGPRVELTADFAGRRHSWWGRIVRTEGEIDPQTRMVHAIARVADPYGRGSDPGRPPLSVGMFVEAAIQGRTARQVASMPRAVLRGSSQVLVVDEQERLRFREVEVVKADQEQVLIGAGLEDGERVVVSPLEAVTDGMRVRLYESGPESPGGETREVMP